MMDFQAKERKRNQRAAHQPMASFLPIAALALVSASGCGPQHPYYDSYTRVEPRKQEIVGAYQGQAAWLLLVSDGSFLATGVPTTHDDTRKHSLKGKWALRAQRLNKVADEAEGILWYLEFTETTPLNAVKNRKGATAAEFPQRASLINNQPPYTLLFEYDVEGDFVLELERE